MVTQGQGCEVGKCQMQWVASTLQTTSEHAVSSITTADAHTSAASSRLNWRPPTNLKKLLRFAERRNLVSPCVSLYFKCSLHFDGKRPQPVSSLCSYVMRRLTAFCVAFSVSRLRAVDKKPLQPFLSLFSLTACKRTVTVNTAPLWSLQGCIKSFCMCLECYFRHVLVFVRQSSGKLFICSKCSDSCQETSIIRSLKVGYCINAGGW